MNNKINIEFSSISSVKYEQGSKRIVAQIIYRGNNKIYEVLYFDKEYDRFTHTNGYCCQSPTFANTEKGALRQINKFFNVK